MLLRAVGEKNPAYVGILLSSFLSAQHKIQGNFSLYTEIREKQIKVHIIRASIVGPQLCHKNIMIE